MPYFATAKKIPLLLNRSVHGLIGIHNGVIVYHSYKHIYISVFCITCVETYFCIIFYTRQLDIALISRKQWYANLKLVITTFWCEMEPRHHIQRYAMRWRYGYNAGNFLKKKILRIDTLWGRSMWYLCVFKVWYSHCSAAWNVILFWTVLQLHPGALYLIENTATLVQVMAWCCQVLKSSVDQ